MSSPDPAIADRLSAAVSAVSPSLVQVHGTRSPITATGIAWGPDRVVSTSSGTWGMEGIRITLPDGRMLPATVLGRDPGTDLLVLSVPGADLPLPARRSLEGLAPGALAVVVGRRRGAVRASWGHLTEVGGAWLTPGGGEVDGLVEVDAELPRGLTGSALVDLDGRLLGVNTRKLRRHGATVPVQTVDRVVGLIEAHGSLRPGWLGTSVLALAISERSRDAAGQDTGLILLEVQPEGPADQAGWLQGDLLLSLDGRALESSGALRQALGSQTVGRAVPARLVRAGQVITAPVTIAAKPRE